MLKFNYEYTNRILDNNRKYPDSSNEPVDAVYTPAPLSCDRGNPLIECLPLTPSKEDIKRLYFTPFAEECNVTLSKDEQLFEVQRLRDIRMPLPFYHPMEIQFYNALTYSARQRLKDLRNKPFKIVMEDTEIIQAVDAKSAMGGDTGIGVTLLGIGGCGKSEAVANMVSRYPQIIHHSIPGIGEFHQILWLNVVTPANANLNNLYIAIARALDEAVGNRTPVYEKLVKGENNVGAKAKYIAQLIRQFNICAIILDEIQNLDSRSNRDSSYNSLMEIINTTKVALVIVGTEEAYTMLCRKYYLARRTGRIIDASQYCYDQTQFVDRMRFIMKYNWFYPNVVMADEDELLTELYKLTHGVIDRMISLWIDVQITYITARDKNKPEITSEFIRRVSNNSNPLMAAYTEQTLENSPLLPEVIDTPTNNHPEQSVDIVNARQHSADNLIMQVLKKVDRPKQAERVFQKVKETLIILDTPYNDSNILSKVVSVMNRKNNKDCSDAEIAKKVIVALKRKSSDARPSVSLPEIDMDSFISNNTEY